MWGPFLLLRAGLAVGLCCLMASGACDKSSRPSTPAAPSPSVPAPPPPSGQVIRLGDPVAGTITPDSRCKSGNGNPQFDNLCHTFEITAPEEGTLVTTVQWTEDAPLALYFRTTAGQIIDQSCCGRPAVGRLPVRAGSVIQIEVAYIGRPPGYPASIRPVSYTMETVLIIGGQQQRGNLRAIVFGDDTRTQRLSQAHLEVLDGPSAGRVARLNEVEGVYEIPDLPLGFVRTRTSAPGFGAVEEELIVGSQIERSIVLQRVEPLVDAKYSLAGHVTHGTPNEYLVGVKIEILNGPLAGAFTLTDLDMGLYSFKSLPPGVMQIRASMRGVSQTVSVDIPVDRNFLVFNLQ